MKVNNIIYDQDSIITIYTYWCVQTRLCMRGTGKNYSGWSTTAKNRFLYFKCCQKRSKKVGHHPGTSILFLLFRQRRRSLDSVLDIITVKKTSVITGFFLFPFITWFELNSISRFESMSFRLLSPNFQNWNINNLRHLCTPSFVC